MRIKDIAGILFLSVLFGFPFAIIFGLFSAFNFFFESWIILAAIIVPIAYFSAKKMEQIAKIVELLGACQVQSKRTFARIEHSRSWDMEMTRRRYGRTSIITGSILNATNADMLREHTSRLIV